MQTAWMNDADLAQAYGFTVGESFNDRFGSASIENLMLYVVALAIYVLEALMGEHRTEVDAQIEAMIPHRPKWYRDKALAFMKDKTLPADSDTYDTTGMSETEIGQARVVKYAAATESADASLLTVKIAGGSPGALAPVDTDTETQVSAYFAEIKDAGVRINLVNKAADRFSCSADIYYDPMLTAGNVREACERAIASYIGNLPFNGEYTNMALVDALQAVDGVRIVEFGSATVKVDGESTPTAIDARHRPSAGHMKVESLTLSMKPYDEQV